MLAPESFPNLGERYPILRKIGAGGMGAVYLAQDTRHNRQVAIKVLDSDYARIVGRQRFLREIRMAATLSHPNIVTLYDSDEVDGHLFYSMPFIEGESLRERLNKEAMLPVAQVVQWAAEVADALAFAHAHGIVHRDIKPENLLIHAGHLVIADFGIARAIDLAAEENTTSEQLVLGTPTYMSPEQASHGRLDGRTDVYSLGCVVFEMLTGEPPFAGATPQAITAKKMAGHYPSIRVVRPAIPQALDQALARALAPIPADRISSAEDFSSTLRDAAERHNFRVLPWLVALGVVVGAIVLGLTHAPRGTRPTALRPRLVVRMLENRTGEPRYDALGFMAADWVTEGLQRTGAVDVVPTPTALAATRFISGRPGIGDPVRALALETDATLVVTGAIYRERDSLIFQAQLANVEAGRLVGAVEPLRTGIGQPAEALRQLRARLMGLLALSLDDRVISTERPPTYGAYQAFSEGMDAYVRGDYTPALVAFERSYALDTAFVLPLLYASFCHNNRHYYAAADSVLRILARERGRLNEADRYWLDYQRSELAGDRPAALAAIRRVAELQPFSKATYNFAVTAYESRQPFAAESALGRLSPDLGPMRGWFPYWEVLTSAFHAEQKHDAELKAARETLRRFPDRIAAFITEARALAATHKAKELELLWSAAAVKANAKPTELGTLAYEVGSELSAHGDSSNSRTWFSRAYGAFAARAETSSPIDARWGKARAAARLSRLDEALRLSEGLDAEDPTRRDDYIGFLGVVAAQAGYRVRARALLDQLAAERRPYTFGRPQFQAGRIAAALGDLDRAADLLASAGAQGHPYEMDFHRDPILALLRGLPILRQLDARRE